MTKINLADGSFEHAYASGYGGENMYLNRKPMHFTWDRSCSSPGPVFYTDAYIEEARLMDDDRKKIAWLIEPSSIRPGVYERIRQLEDRFDYILTFDDEYVSLSDKYLYYPIGGSWISPDHWGIHDKSKMVSTIVSEKRRAEGHKLRHNIAQMFGPLGVDIMGRAYRTIQSKREALDEYRYHIVVENARIDTYFTEKLIDCFTQGAVPIYWGPSSVTDIFDKHGIITFETTSELQYILDRVVCKWDYTMRRHAIHNNFELAQKYVCAEDWIWDKYPFLFINERR